MVARKHNLKKPLTEKQKAEIEAVVKKAVEQYKDVFKKLAKE